MLSRLNPNQLQCTAPQPLSIDDRWTRNECEDLKTAIEHLYAFREKLSKLHPVVLDAIENMMQRPRY